VKGGVIMMKLKKILVATDFGEAAEAAFLYGRELARNFGATLDVLHVADNLFAHAVGAEGFVAAYPAIQADIEEAARQQLEQLVCDEDRAVLKAKTIIRVSPTPAMAIVDYAREANIDLIVIGTHGRGAMAHLLMGSVAERVVRTAPCPVLTVRHPEHEFVVPDALMTVAKA
jgi:nucleotide-binding universal stress UspA family protein